MAYSAAQSTRVKRVAMAGALSAALSLLTTATALAAPGDRGPMIRAQAPTSYIGGQPALDGSMAPRPAAVPQMMSSGGQAVMPAAPDAFQQPSLGQPPTAASPGVAIQQPTWPGAVAPQTAPIVGYQNAPAVAPSYNPQPFQTQQPYAAAPYNGAPYNTAAPAAAPGVNPAQGLSAIPRGANLVPGNAPTTRSAYYQNPAPAGAPEAVGPGTPVAPGSPVQVFDQGPAPFVQVEPWLPVDVYANETQTGKLSVGVGVNSDAGLVGNVTIDEQNFDITRWPTSWEDFRTGQAFRGAGERFRVEAAPGTLVQRYVISFAQPYLFDTPVSFSTSASYFTRIYQDWREARVGGRFNLGYYFTPDLSGTVGFRLEKIRVTDPTVPTPPELAAVIGNNYAYGPNVGFSHDTRDSPFLPSQGHLLRVNYEQVFGSYSYPQVTLDGRQYFKISERPDGSGKHTLGFGTLLGFSGGNTPIYDHFFAGGFSTMRGFQFRGASPLDMGVEVGGNFEFLNTVEYMFPLTADDALRGVFFCDYGTVEPNAEIKWQDFRISPGFGLRISIPALGPAPIALDFAFPVHKMPGDRLEFFSFSVGLSR